MTMHSWVFRNRSRLRWIYGPGASQDPSEPARLPAPAPAPTHSRAELPSGAGRVERDRAEADVVLNPMPRRAG